MQRLFDAEVKDWVWTLTLTISCYLYMRYNQHVAKYVLSKLDLGGLGVRGGLVLFGVLS